MTAPTGPFRKVTRGDEETMNDPPDRSGARIIETTTSSSILFQDGASVSFGTVFVAVEGQRAVPHIRITERNRDDNIVGFHTIPLGVWDELLGSFESKIQKALPTRKVRPNLRQRVSRAKLARARGKLK